MRSLFRRLRKALYQYEPLVEVRISKARLIDNYRSLKQLAPVGGLAPVLKSNAYGHGLVSVATILDKEKPPFFVVDSYFEALTLRNEGIKSPILIIGFTHLENVCRSRLKDTAFTLSSLEQVSIVAKRLTKPTTFHLKIDTGMNRQGVRVEEIAEALRLIKGNPKIILEGVCSHFANAASPDTTDSRKQIDRWHSALKIVRQSLPNLKFAHLSATSGHRFAGRIDANISRSGIGLYGIATEESLKRSVKLLPVLSMRSIITGTKKVLAGESVGYENLFVASKNMLVATVPAGYYEGIDKRLTNRGVLEVEGVLCPIVGRVSMNITTIDVSQLSKVKIGDRVLVISNDPDRPNSIEQIATQCGTNPHEILVHIPNHIRRVVS
jgi:alanine racemase